MHPRLPKPTVIDNLRAAVARADLCDSEIKGKVEAGIKYGQNNALKGRALASLAEQNLFLSNWECMILPKADGRLQQRQSHFAMFFCVGGGFLWHPAGIGIAG